MPKKEKELITGAFSPAELKILESEWFHGTKSLDDLAEFMHRSSGSVIGKIHRRWPKMNRPSEAGPLKRRTKGEAQQTASAKTIRKIPIVTTERLVATAKAAGKESIISPKQRDPRTLKADGRCYCFVTEVATDKDSRCETLIPEKKLYCREHEDEMAKHHMTALGIDIHNMKKPERF